MIDILLATYNGEKYISKQLVSIVSQELGNELSQSDVRVIIRDDASTDDTVAVIKKRLRSIRNIYKERAGIKVNLIEDKVSSGSAAANFVRLLKMSDGDYVMFSDQDDIWSKSKVRETYECMKKCEQSYGANKPILVHTDLYVVDEDGGKISNSFFEYESLRKTNDLKDLMIQNNVTGCTVMINKAAINLLKRVSADEMPLLHDSFLSVLVSATGHVEFIDKPTVKYRQHNENVVGARDAYSIKELTRRFKNGKKDFRTDMDKSYMQAGIILKKFRPEIKSNLGDEAVDMLSDYSSLLMKSSSEKREVFEKYGIYKEGALKKTMQKLWC